MEKKRDGRKRLSPAELAEECRQIADNVKAENIVRLDLEGISVLADHFLICTGNSDPHIKAIAEHLRRAISKQYKINPLALDGEPGSHWLVLDYGPVIVHVMSPAIRELYQLESLWGDAPQIEAVRKLEKGSPR